LSYHKDMNNTFSSGEALRFGWNTFKSRVGFILLIVLIIFGINFAFGFISGMFDEESVLQLPVGIVSYAVQLLLQMGMINIALKFVDGQKPEVADLFNVYPLALKFFGGSLLYGVMVTIGFILLIIPGIYLALKYALFSYYIIDKGLGPIAALKASGEATQGNKWNLLGFYLLCVLINIVGVLLIFIGLVVTIPVTALAMAFVYRRLSKAVGGTPLSATPPPTPPPLTPPPTSSDQIGLPA
jgi:hypothetical protein